MASESPKVFISYSHDSLEHSQRVLRFAQRLRRDGIDADLDQYISGTPAKGWPRWMLDRLDWAEFVIVVCTETYYRRFRGHAGPSQGKGVDWEGHIISLEMYEERSATKKFIPIYFAPEEEQYLPEPMRGHTRYLVDSEARYGDLLAFVTGQAGVKAAELGVIANLATRNVEPLTFASSSEEDGNDILPGVRLVHIMVAQIFRMEGLYRNPETIRPRRLAQILTNQAKWRRLLNGRKPLPLGDLGELRPLINSGERFNPFWKVSQSSQFRHDPFIYFIPLELNLSDTRKFSRFKCDLQAILEGKSDADISNCQVSGSIRIYPHGIGVVRLGLAITFGALALSSVIAKVVGSVQDLYFIDANSLQTHYQTLVFETVGRIISAVFGNSADSPENVCWLPPIEALSIVAQNQATTPPPIRQLAYLMSRAPGNDEPDEALTRRLSAASHSKGWRDGKMLAVAGEGVALFYALNTTVGASNESLRRIQLCFREAYELVSVARYSGLAFAQQIETIAARRELNDAWLPRAGNERFTELLSLFEEMVAAKRATYQIKIHLQKTGAGILMSFAKQAWAYPVAQTLLDGYLRYVEDWARSGFAQTMNQDLTRLIYLIQEYLSILAPFDS